MIQSPMLFLISPLNPEGPGFPIALPSIFRFKVALVGGFQTTSLGGAGVVEVVAAEIISLCT